MTHDGDEDTTTMASDAEPAAEEAPTCDHNWRRCPFYCPACDTTFLVKDEPVAWRGGVYQLEGDEVEAVTNKTERPPGQLITELAGWGEGEDPPTWP